MKRLTTLVLLVGLLVSTASATDIWQREKGYRGFADIGVLIPVRGDCDDCGDSDLSPLSLELSLSTTHGYQVIPSYLFVGGGIGMDFYLMSMYIPVFADIRTQLPTGKWSPFIDVKFGYGADLLYCTDYYSAIHFAPSIGVTLSTRHRVGFEFALGYTLKEIDDISYETVNVNGVNVERKRHDWINGGGLTIKFGITF